MINRRKFIAGLGVASTLPLVSSAAPLSDGANSSNMTVPPVLTGPRINMARAMDVMAQLNLDALILGHETNFYYATGYMPITTKMGYGPRTFAIITRRHDQPNALVLPSFTYYYQLADMAAEHDFSAYMYSGFGDAEAEAGAEPNLMIFANRGLTAQDAIEANRETRTRQMASKYGAYFNAADAFKKALNDLGLTKGAIATDSAFAEQALAKTTPNINVLQADDVLRRIRPYKSEIEIALMRQAANANAEAAIAAVKQVRSGATYRELRHLFYAEAAKRGNTGVFMVVDRVSDELFDAPFRNGQSFLIDAVSHYNGYHGDYGRTVFIDEPNKELAKITHTIGRTWNEIRHAMKPGMKFSQITALGQQTLKKLGGNYAVSFNPHSVGLYHTDHVGKLPGAQFEDLVLEKGMIISVDCPLLESGIGGSAHLEDLTLITEDGSEAINNVGDQIILV